MSEENQPGKTGASGDPEPTTPVTPPTTPAVEPTTPPVEPTAKVEIKEGKVTVDGKSFVAESQLIAAKKSLEGKLEQQQTAHEQAINSSKLEVSTSQQEIAKLNAKITETEEARKTGVVSDEEATRVKQELETAKTSLEQASAKALEYRRALMVLRYGVAEDTIKEKTIEQLDSFEEAVKALAASKGGGPGPYAIGGGGAEAVLQTDMERAAKVLENTPVRGTRTAEIEK